MVEITDRTFEAHRRGKIHTGLNLPIKTRDDLSMAYTPGVARVCSAIAENRQKAFKYTIKANTVAVVSDGTAVLGLGDIGPEAAMPVMEGKAMLFKEFADVDAFPICLNTKDTDEIVETVIRMSPTFGGINLEDISSPRCFEIEQRLQEALDIPVFHDDQHGTAIVTLAALINACRLTGRAMEDLEVTMVGAGAAGVAVVKILMDAGVRSIVACDRYGAIHTGRDDYEAGSMNVPKRWLAENTNAGRRDGSPREVIEGTNLFIGLSGPGIIDAKDLERMAPDPFVFAMANPNPEVRPEEAAPYVRVMATGRSDYPNQINNVLAFPGVFRGALDVRAPAITEEMKLAAAHGIASVVEDDELAEDYIVPSVFNRDVSRAVAAAVAEVAERTGASRAPGREAVDQPTVEPPPSAANLSRQEVVVKVVVTGATGMIGSALVRALVERGDEVTVLSRSPDDAASKLGVDAVGWKDPLRRPPRRTRFAAATRWCICAGAPVAQRWTDDARREIRDSRVLGTRNLVAGLAALPEAERPATLVSQSAERLVRRPRRRAGRRVGARRRRLPRRGDAGLGGRGRRRGGAGPARGHARAPAWCCPSPAARSRRCCRPSSSAWAARWPAGSSTCRGSISTTWWARCCSPSTRRRRPAP